MTGPVRPQSHAARSARDDASALADYLQKILTARVYDVAIEIAARARARSLSRRLGNQVLLKREDKQPVFSFKLRGAYNKMAHLSAGAAHARRDLRLGRQPCAGRRAAARSASAARPLIVMPVDHAEAQDRRGARARRRGRAARRQLLRRLRPRARAGARARPDLRAPVRRPGRDRRPGHDRDGDPAPAPGPDRRGVRRHRRRRPDLGRGRLHQGGAARDQGDRRADHRLRRDGALGEGRQARAAARRRPVLRRHRGQAGRRGDLPPDARSWSTTSSSSTPTPSAPRSRTCSRTRAASSSRPARWASPRSSSTSTAHGCKGQTSSPSPAAPT